MLPGMPMLQEERKFYYDEGYSTVPPLIVDGNPAFSKVADSVGLHNVEWVSSFMSLYETFNKAMDDGNIDFARDLATVLAEKVSKRIELSHRPFA